MPGAVRAVRLGGSTVWGMTPVVLLDQDGPLADFDAALAAVLRKLGCDPGKLERTTWWTSHDIARDFGPDIADEVVDAVHEPSFFANLPVVAGAREGVQRLLDAGIEVFVCTAPKLSNPSCASDKLAWIDLHLPELRRSVVISKDKTLVRGDVLVDDKPEVTGAMTPVWSHVLFDTPGNAHASSGLRMGSWDDVEWLIAHARETAERGHR
jgi:5'-nucleotidase